MLSATAFHNPSPATRSLAAPFCKAPPRIHHPAAAALRLHAPPAQTAAHIARSGIYCWLPAARIAVETGFACLRFDWKFAAQLGPKKTNALALVLPNVHANVRRARRRHFVR